MVLPELFPEPINLTFCPTRLWKTLLPNILMKFELLHLQVLCLFLTPMYGMVAPQIKRPMIAEVFIAIFVPETNHNKSIKKNILLRRLYTVSVKKDGIF